MAKKKSLLQKLPHWVKSKYVLSFNALLVWMIFFDQHNLISQVQLKMKYWDLANKKEYYSERIAEVYKTRSELFSDDASLEKFAREKYMMKKQGEDVKEHIFDIF